jgi:hypothetical protein
MYLLVHHNVQRYDGWFHLMTERHWDSSKPANVSQSRTSGTMCTSASAVMMPPLNARSSRGSTVFVFLNHSVMRLHMDAANITKRPATLQRHGA